MPSLPSAGAGDVRNVNVTNKAGAQSTTTIAVDPLDSRHLLVASNDLSGGTVTVRVYDSLDGGRTWTEDANFRPLGLCYSPWVDFNANGDAFVTYNCFDQRIAYRLRGQTAWVYRTFANRGDPPTAAW